MPSCRNQNSWLSKAHSEPDERCPPWAVSDVNHSASRTFTTNQPSAAGARPEPESSSRDSTTARVYRVDGTGPVRSRRTPTASTSENGCDADGRPLVSDAL